MCLKKKFDELVGDDLVAYLEHLICNICNDIKVQNRENTNKIQAISLIII